MSTSLTHVDACLPITALKILDWDTSNFILQGQGPFLRVIDDRTGDVCAQVRAFRRNNVHGFITLSQRRHEDGAGDVQVMIWGGQSLRAINVLLDASHSVTLSSWSAEFLAPDWILSGCAAVDDQPGTAYLLTANNALLSLKLLPSQSSHQTAIHIYQVATSVKTTLYAADLIVLSASHILVAAGTVFGEIIVWSCFMKGNEPHTAEAVGSIHHCFTGHDGSIFGVRISPQIPFLNGEQSGRLLASCSDDRTVQIWDISDCENKSPQDRSAYTTNGFELRSTGFGSVTADDSGLGSESCVAKAFGHLSRIWSVNFRPIGTSQPKKMGLVTRGEDSSCVVWDLSWESASAGTMKYQLRDTFMLHHHSGRHIWSLDLCSRGEETIVYTGGADGALKSFVIKENDPPASAQHNVPTQARQSKIGIQAFAFVAPDSLIAYSVNNELQLGIVSAEENASITWETLRSAENFRSPLLITGVPRKRVALIGNAQGLIQLYNHSTKSVTDLVDIRARLIRLFALESSSQSESLSFLVSNPTDDMATFVTVTGWNSDCPRAEVFPFSLPEAPFAVSSAALMNKDQYLLIGSKLGGFAVYRVPGLGLSSEPVIEHRRLHGREGTNHIQVVSSVAEEDGTSLECVLTCGRDGYYCLHEIKVSGDGDDAVSLETVHRTSSALGGNLEGAYHDEATGDLMIYGFRSQDFVLRNESKQTDLISIASGGARRAWTFQPPTGSSMAMLLWKEGTNLRGIRIRTDLNRCLRAGGHGREIKAMHILDAVQGNRAFFATGSEDTTVRIFALSSPASASPWGSFECLRVLNSHTSGLQQVSWSKNGQYLFTSAAYEEFFVWRIRSVPSFGVATILVAASPKDDPNSDLRITSFDLVEVKESESEQGYLLCLALSNSTIKIFHFSPFDGGRFTLLARGTYMTNCLTQGHFLVKDSSVSLITAATDGHFTLWDLTSTLEPFYTIASSALTTRPSLRGSSFSPGKITCENRYQIHSNSIKAMELVALSDTVTVVVAGGDDNSLSVSLLKTSPTTSATNAHVATVSIPDVHTASITTLKVLRQQKSRAAGSDNETTTLTVASSGNDHRVKLWSITLDPTQHDTEAIHIELLLDRYSSVADISSLGLIKGAEYDSNARSSSASEEIQEKLLVCGVGMEMLEVKLR